SRNAQDGISYVQTAEGAYNEVTDMLQRMNELAVQAANGTNTTTQRGYINDEIVALKQEINRIGSDTKFNGLSAFGSTISFHVGSENTTAAQINVTTAKLTCEALGLSGPYFATVTEYIRDSYDVIIGTAESIIKVEPDSEEALKNSNSVLTQDEARAFLDTISAALSTVSGWRSDLGAIQNRLEYAIKNLDNVVENTATAESRIRDTDMSTEMVSYSNNQILAQAGQAMLAQANQANQGVLSLL
ncbi:MAG: flagellin, partial [Eubacteriales bacterium]